jgi:transglutaminase-like putative cysteine protease
MSMAHKTTTHDLHWLLLSLTLVMALHVTHFPVWVSLFVVGFGAWRYLIAHKGWQLPRLWLLLPLTLLGALGIVATYRGLFGRDASVALLAVMLALKLMETQNQRDHVLLIFAGYFLTITAFLFNQSIAVGAFMLLPLIGLTAALIGVSHPNGELGWRFRTKLAGSLLAQAAPVMLALFLLFPRVPGPLWGVPQDAYSSMSGLSDSMSPGDISQLSLSGAIAFRVEFDDAAPTNNRLYWRGPVLWHYDGRSWLMNRYSNMPVESLQVQGQPKRYRVTLEPHNRNWLLMLDMPTALPPDAVISPDWQVLARRPVRTRMRYEGASHLDYTLGLSLAERARERALQLPENGNPRSRALARQWAAESDNPQEIVQRALRMYSTQQFIYTLAPPRLGTNAMDEFLFSTRRGFCEHYAGSFVFLMRAAGVPARVVTGYQGGELNPVGNYLIVRQSDAHAWAEVWLEGRGWVRVDPTAAVAPSRVEMGIAGALPQDEALPLLARRDYPWLRKLYLNWDAVNNGWNQWVLGYNQQRQLELLSRLTGSRLTWQDLALALMTSVAAIVLAISYVLLRGRRQKLEPLQRLYAEFLHKLKSAGLRRLPQEGPQDFGKRAAQRLPAQAAVINEITETYLRLRYRKADPQTLQELRRKIKSFRLGTSKNQ